MLLVLMYHGVSDPAEFNEHLDYISSHYPIVVPGDVLPSFGLSVCLTFDDAYFDFYHRAFPILLSKQIKAVLGVPAGYIVDESTVDSEVRLKVAYEDAMKDEIFIKKTPFCTWREMEEMADSGLVKIASHSKNHVNLIDGEADLSDEIIGSKKLIEQRLSQKVEIFIYPFGKVNNKVHKFALEHYKYLMRIGSALNKDWHNLNNIIYRVNGDKLINERKYINNFRLFKYYLKYLSNTIRGR